MDPIRIKIMRRDSTPQEYIVDVEKELAHPRPQERFFFYSGLLGETMALQTLLDAEYRQARASFLISALNEDSKVSEWKAKAAFERTSQFMKYKEGEAAILRNVVTLSGILDTLYWNRTGGKVRRSVEDSKIQ